MARSQLADEERQQVMQKEADLLASHSTNKCRHGERGSVIPCTVRFSLIPGGGAVGRPRVSVRDEMKMKPKKIWDLEFYAGNYAKLSRKCVGSFLTNLLVDLGMGPAKGMPDGVTPDGATTVPSSITTRDCRRALLVQDQKSLHVFYDEII